MPLDEDGSARSKCHLQVIKPTCEAAFQEWNNHVAPYNQQQNLINFSFFPPEWSHHYQGHLQHQLPQPLLQPHEMKVRSVGGPIIDYQAEDDGSAVEWIENGLKS